MTAEQIPLTDNPLNKSNEVAMPLGGGNLTSWSKGKLLLLYAKKITTTNQWGNHPE